MSDFWQKTLDRLRTELPEKPFTTWVKPLEAVEKDAEITLFAPNRILLQWVRDNYLARIEELAKGSGIQLVSLKTRPKDHGPQPVASGSRPPEAPAIVARDAGPQSHLNPQFTLDNFIEGKSNHLARAAALQVCENPGLSYNPMFIYGGSGLGKTHLIHAIGNEIMKRRPDTKMRYVSSTTYVSELVRAYQHKTFDDMRRRYHNLDLLLVDDVQFFSGKQSTQESFFSTFNALVETQKQLVVTCDRLPHEIENMEERLISRFSWGLTVWIEPPELELRVAILLDKARRDRIPLTEEVAFFIAKAVRAHVRELEGALTRVKALAGFKNHPIDIPLVKEALRDILALRSRQISIENIQKTVADFHKIKLADMFSKKRTRILARPRQMAMALAKELTQLSLPDIGEAFGGRDHTTVLHACRKVRELCEEDSQFNRDYQVLMQVLNG
jgi:chromosomal replication initiator protein